MTAPPPPDPIRPASSAFRLDPRAERRRRVRLFTIVVPRLLDRHLKPLLGGRRWPFIAGLFWHAPAYRRAFARPSDDAGLREVKRTFLLVGVLYQRLRRHFDDRTATRVASAFLFDLACAVQRAAYVPADWDRFHDVHEAQMREGFIRHNENDGVRRTHHTVSLHVTRCRFFEAFRDMGNVALTEAFCRSDETVFNELPVLRFHRGVVRPDTIARGAPRCTFIFERRAP